MLFDGYIRLKVKGDNFGGFMSKCKKEGISLYNIKISDKQYYFDVKAKELENMMDIAAICGTKPLVCGRFGLKMKILMYKSRKAFFIVFLALSFFYGANTCFISEICITGNNTFADCQILECLKENGLYVGRFKFGINPEVFQNEVIKDFPEISWIWVKIDGTKAIVEVREKVSLPKFFDNKDYGNMVASRDGVIKSGIASGGTLLVSEGMFVKKGDILISGVYDSTKNAPIRFINADGNVFATTTYTMEDDFGHTIANYSVSDTVTTDYTAELFNIKLWSDNSIDQNTMVISKDKRKYRILGKIYLPLAFTKTKYCEIIKKETVLSEKQAKDIALDTLLKKITLTLPDGAQIVDVKNETQNNPDGTFKMKVTVTCIEDIAVKQPIEVEE